MHRLAWLAPLLLLPRTADAAVVLLSKRDASQVVRWDSASPDSTTLVHATKCNDVDYNTAEGLELAWVVEHFDDDFGRFVMGSDVGLDAVFHLGDNGLTHYDYPKHVVAYNGEVVISSRNDGTLWRYTPLGVQVGSVDTPAALAQGSASDGDDLWVSLWSGGPSQFVRYDPGFVALETVENPTGMGDLDNIFDLVHDPATGHFFGLATTGEFGTPTESSTILEFTMGGAVHMLHMLPVKADGIGRVNGSVCGDLVVDPGEQCDDGDADDTNSCTAACLPATCGDGIVWTDVEDCDDADADDADACSSACTLSFCGDGVVWTDMEACDDGNDVDDDACTNACTLPTCGDGIVQAGEACDDPNPLLCQDCVAVRPDLTTTTATTDDTTTTADTTTTTDALTSSTEPDSASGGDSASASGGDVPTTGAPIDATTTAPAGTTSGGFSGSDGGADDGGCGCTTGAPPPPLALLVLLLPTRRRRLTAAARRAGPTAPGN